MLKQKIKCFFNWSGGKDSSLALYYLLQDPVYEVCFLVTTMNDGANRISMHGVREELLLAQAASIGIPLVQIRLPEMPDMETYDQLMHEHYLNFKRQGITHAGYGDIFLQNLKNYRDNRLAEAGLTGIYPLWLRNTHDVINEFLGLKFKTIIVCTQAHLKYFVGKEVTGKLINRLPPGIDVCGENGEFHTFTYAGPIFGKPVSVAKGQIIFKSYKAPQATDAVHTANVQDTLGFWYCDLLPVQRC